jgi:hypothetical protein
MYVQMLNTRLLDLHEILFTLKAALSEHFMGVEDEYLEKGYGGGYANIWSGIGTGLENNQAVANLVGKITQQVKVNAGNAGTVMAKANQDNVDSGALKMQLVGMY